MEEVNEALDKIISINHKIVSFLIEIAKMENEGKAIDEKFILENNILTTLFELQICIDINFKIVVITFIFITTISFLFFISCLF